MTDTAEKPTATPLPGAVAAPPKKSRTETLFVAYEPDDTATTRGFADAAIFGRKIEALEYASDQEDRWRVIEITKGESIKATIVGKS